MKKLILAIGIIGIAICLIVGFNKEKKEKPEFKTFTNRDDGFCIDMPGEPEEDMRLVIKDGEYLQLKIFSIVENDYSYISTISDFPESELESRSVDKILENAADGAVTAVKGDLKGSSDICFGDYQGKELVYKVNQNGIKVTYHQRIYLVEDKLYQLLYVCLPGFENPEHENRFFESFRLIDENEKNGAKRTEKTRTGLFLVCESSGNKARELLKIILK